MKITSIFKKTAVFSLAMTLILLMAISVMPLASAADEEISAGFETSAIEGETTFGEKLVAMNVSQSGNIKMLFYFTFDNSTLDADDYIEITIPQLKKEAKVMKIAKGDLKDAGNGRYLVEVPVAAAQQTDLVSLQWFKSDDGTVTPGKIRKYSVRYYADRVLNLAKDEEKASESNPETVKKYSNQVNNVMSMLNYGAMAQKMFNYNDGTDGEARLANAGLFGESNPVDNMTAANMIGVTASEKPEPANGVEFLHSQAFLQDTVQLRVYFNAPEGATAKLKRNGEYVGGNDNPTEFKIWTEEGTGYRYVNINNVAAHNFDVKFTVEINVDGKATSMDCSVLEYALRALESYKTTDEQKDTARAIYLYYAWMKNYVTNDTFKPGKTDSEGNEIVCKHERSHIEVDKVVCSDCGYTGYATRLSLTANPVELIENEPTDVAFTIKVDNATNLQALIITLTPDDSDKVTLTFKSMVLGDGSSQTPIEGTANLNVVLDSSEPINGSATLATVVYTVNASESGTYKITPTVREATNSSKTDISSTIATSMVALVVKEPECAEHTLEYDITAEEHRGYCEVCQRVFDAEKHTEKSTWSSADKLYTFACSVCNHKLYTSDMVYKTEPYNSADGDSAKGFLTTTTVTEDGMTFRRYTAGETIPDDAFFWPYRNGSAVTGKFMVIRYRVSNGGTDLGVGQVFASSAASGKQPGATGSSSNYTTSAWIDDGEWHAMIVHPKAGNETFTPNADGTVSWGYLRININGIKPGNYVDIAEIAFADNIDAAEYYADKNNTIVLFSNNLDLVKIDDAATGDAGGGGDNKPKVVDLSNKTITNAATSLKLQGWCVTPGGVDSYKLRVTVIDGEKVASPELLDWIDASTIGEADAVVSQGKGRGFGVNCRYGARYYETPVDLTAWIGYTIDFEIVAITNFGREATILQINNVNIPCPNHVIVDVEAKAPTCATPGNEAYKTCESCGRIYNTNSEEIDAIPTLDIIPTAHNKVNKTWTAPTTKEDGWEAHTACTYCGKAWNAEGTEIAVPSIAKIVYTTNKYWGYEEMKNWNISEGGTSTGTIITTPSTDRSYVRFSRNGLTEDCYAQLMTGNNTVTGQYVIVKYRTDSSTSGEFWANTTENGHSGGTANFTMTFTHDSKWHIEIFDLSKKVSKYVKANDNGEYIIQWARLDMLNNKLTEGYFDIAYIAYADDVTDFASIIQDGDEDLCPHYTTADAVWTLDKNDPQHISAICSVCGEEFTQGATLTTGGATAFIGGSNLDISHGGTKKLLTETYGNKLPLNFTRLYARGLTNSSGTLVEERATIYTSSTTKVPTKRYMAMMWRSSINTSVELALDDTASVQRNVNSLGTAPVGKWHFNVINYADHASYWLEKGAGNVTIDYINGSVARTKDVDYTDVAFVAFFDSAAEAWEYYNLYAAAYLSEDECQHFARSEDCSFVAIGDGKMAQHCACGKIIDESYCQHSDFDKLTNVQAVTNDSVTDYIADCGVCGATGIEVDISTPGGLQFYNAGRLQSIMNANTDSLKYNLDYPILKDENGIPYLHAVDNVGHENYMYLNYGGDTNLTNVGKFFAVMYKNTVQGVSFQLYLNTPGTINHTGAKSPSSATLDKSGNWGLAVIDFTTWAAFPDEAGWVRFDFIDNTYAKGNSVDMAWAGFFNTLDEANEYYAAYLDKYSVEEHVCAADHDWKMGDDIFTYTKVCTVCGKEIGEAQTNISEHGNLAWSPETIKNLGYSENTALKTLTLMEDKENGGLPFLRIQYTTETSAENYLWLNKAANKKYNAGKVVAFIYRNSGGGIRANEMFAKRDDGIGSGNNKYSYNYMKASSNLNSTSWALGYFDYTNNDSYDAWNGLGAMRLDVANGGTVKVGDYLDIAAVVTFNTVDEAIEFYDKVANMYDFNAVLNRYCFDSLKVGGTSVVAGDKGWKNTTQTYDVTGYKVGSADAQCISISGWYLNPYGTEGYYYRVTDEDGTVSDLKYIKAGTNNAPGNAINNVGKGLGYNVNTCGIGSSFAFSLNYNKFAEYEGQTITVELIAKHIMGREAVMVTLENLTVCAHDVASTAADYHPVIENDGNADGKLYEVATCPTCGAEFKRVLAFNSWTDHTRINRGDSLGSIGNGGTKDLATQSAATPATTVQVAGWIATNGGVKAYYYRVNGGEWIKTDGCSAGTLGNNVLTHVGDAFYNYAAGGLHNGGTGISTKNLTTDYADQVVKIEFGAVPLNNPGTDEKPNVFTFVTLTNVQVAPPTVPNYVIDANALKGTTEHTGLTYALDASGDFVTYTQKTDGSSDCYFYATFPGAGVNVPSAPTGKYVLVKYRTTYTGSWEMFVGANNGYTTAKGGLDSFGLNVNNGSNNGAIIADGKWQYLILDLKFVESWGGVKPEDGTTDTYQIDYLRIDLFNAASDVANTVDIAYVAYADDVNTLVDYAGMASYTFGDSYSGGVVGQTVVVGE